MLLALRNATTTAAVISIIALVILIWFQMNQLVSLRSDLADARTDLADMKAAVALTDRLRRDNAKLIEEREILKGELRHAAGYTDPLSDDIRRILGRLQLGEAAAAPGGATR